MTFAKVLNNSKTDDDRTHVGGGRTFVNRFVTKLFILIKSGCNLERKGMRETSDLCWD